MKDAFGNSNRPSGNGNMQNGMPNINFSNPFVIGGIILLILIIGFARSFQVIDAKERGIVRYLGKLSEIPLEPGIHIEVPFISVITKIDISTKKLELGNIKIYTRDQQSATLSSVANYNIKPDKVIKLYNKLGTLNKALFEETIVLPILQSTIRNEMGKWTAEQVITEKERIAARIFDALIKAQDESGFDTIISFSNFEITGLNLDEAYEAAVRAKVIAEQQAKTAENKTKQIQEEAKQRVIQARAEAESMKIRSEALSKNKSLVEYEAVQKWDGKLPQYMMGGSVPFINLDTKEKSGK
jgi:regulator of protease activity HflC (stomatin/prohibitin superfamily)